MTVGALLGTLALAALLLAVAKASLKWRRARLPAWRLAAERAGVEDIVVDQEAGVVRGRWHDVAVRVTMPAFGKSEAAAKIVADASGTGRGGLSLRCEGVATALDMRLRGEREVQIGDPSFDAQFFVQGDAPLALALLDADTQAALGRLMRGALVTRRGDFVPVLASLRDGVLEVRLEEGSPSEPRRGAGDVLAAVLELAGRLVPPRDVAARIAGNLRTEPEAGVRLRCLRTLAREFPAHPATREAALAAREDPDAEVRLEAGIALGPEGREVLIAVAEGEGVPDETSARAVAALGGQLSAAKAVHLLEAASRARRLRTAIECVRLLGHVRDEPVLPVLAKALAIGEASLAAAAAGALATAAGAAAEPALLSALENPAGKVREAAARALGRVGTVVAVQPLKDLEQRDGSCRAVARQAIAEIQSRLTGAEPGQLSLARGEAGELAIAEGGAGALSLADGSRDGRSFATGQTEVAQDDGEDPHRARVPGALGNAAKG